MEEGAGDLKCSQKNVREGSDTVVYASITIDHLGASVPYLNPSPSCSFPNVECSVQSNSKDAVVLLQVVCTGCPRWKEKRSQVIIIALDFFCGAFK